MNLHRQSIQSACASREIPLLAPCAVLEGCASSWPYNINLMPAPAVFADAVVNPLPRGPDAVRCAQLNADPAQRSTTMPTVAGPERSLFLADPNTEYHDGAGGWLLLN